MSDMNKYPFTVRPLTEEEGGGFLIEYVDLPGCISDGETIEEALLNGRKAAEDWIDASKKLGKKIPLPSNNLEQFNYSGKVLQRFPKSLHAKLAYRARQEGVSLNSLIQYFVAEGLGRKTIADEYLYLAKSSLQHANVTPSGTNNNLMQAFNFTADYVGANLPLGLRTSPATASNIELINIDSSKH